jgi:hypothetical protein
MRFMKMLIYVISMNNESERFGPSFPIVNLLGYSTVFCWIEMKVFW